jgi:uncharacterized protein involved in cysteine biosynthesis
MTLKGLIREKATHMKGWMVNTKTSMVTDWRRWLVRVIIILIFGLFAYAVQLFKHHQPDVPKMEDHTHEWLKEPNRVFIDSHFLRNFFTALSSFFVDCSVLFFLIGGMLSGTSRTVLNFAIVMTLRQLSQLTVDLPIPKHLWFEYPGFPSLFVNYAVKNDFFFSGHTCLAMMVTLEVRKLFPTKRWLLWLTSLVSVHQMIIVLIFRTHYIQDVVSGFFAPFFVQFVAKKLAKKIDAWCGLDKPSDDNLRLLPKPFSIYDEDECADLESGEMMDLARDESAAP